MNFKLFLINKQQQKEGQILLSELDKRHGEHEVCVIIAKKSSGPSSRDEGQIHSMSSLAVQSKARKNDIYLTSPLMM